MVKRTLSLRSRPKVPGCVLFRRQRFTTETSRGPATNPYESRVIPYDWLGTLWYVPPMNLNFDALTRNVRTKADEARNLGLTAIRQIQQVGQTAVETTKEQVIKRVK